MKESEVIEALQHIHIDYDYETAHIQADYILLEFLSENGYEDISMAFIEARNACKFGYKR